jgi:cytochrome c oxidase subunit 2
MTVASLIWSTLVGSAHAQSAFMPPQGTQIAVSYDNLYYFLLVASAISCLILIGGMIYFAFKYRRRSKNDKTPYIAHNSLLEFIWSFIPFVIFMIVFIWGWKLYREMRTMPANAFEVNVVARQWAWDFYYKSGKTMTNEFVVPVGTPVKLIMTAKDVLHSFYIPSMRIKQDVIPGRYTTLWFNADKLGDYQVFCTEFCGAAHSQMLAKMKVVSKEDFEIWLQENDADLSLDQRGLKAANSLGCIACHSVDGSVKVGPTWKGLWDKKGHQMDDGSVVDVDENYIRVSILQPAAKTVKGYPKGAMPSYQGQISEEQLTAINAYLQTLK